MKHPLHSEYRKKRHALDAALARFKKTGTMNEKNLFAELCFCLCTPQSKAHNCDRAIRNLVTTNNLFTGDAQTISTILVKGVRFHKNKAQYIINARNTLTKHFLTKILAEQPDSTKLREWLVHNIKGLGYKEATHFLRNIGKGEDLAILDRHILRNLVRHKVIRTLPKTLTRKKYYTIEKKMQKFAADAKIPPAALDLLWWSNETGEIFK